MLFVDIRTAFGGLFQSRSKAQARGGAAQKDSPMVSEEHRAQEMRFCHDKPSNDSHYWSDRQSGRRSRAGSERHWVLSTRPDAQTGQRAGDGATRHGVDIVKGDLDDEVTLRRALPAFGASSACRTRGRRASSGRSAGQASRDASIRGREGRS